MLAEDEVDLSKCAAMDLMSEEEDGARWRGVWINCATSVLSHPEAHRALRHTAITCEAIPKYSAAHHRHLPEQTHRGAVGFWASCELPICCVGRLCFVHAVCLCLC